MRRSILLLLLFFCTLLSGFVSIATAQQSQQSYFGIQVVDAESGSGVPLVELETINNIRFVTDSAGWVAIDEPDFRGREVFFHVRSHGYELDKDGFGFAGKKILVTPGGRAKISIRRLNIAKRLFRITGAGIFRDSQLLGEPIPSSSRIPPNGDVVGQDSAFAVPYQGKLFWFWGDTSRLNYPLGHFWMAGATSTLPTASETGQAFNIEQGIDLHYFVDKSGFSRPMARLGVKEGMIWADGFLTLRDSSGTERLVCHYAHMASLDQMISHGLAVYNDKSEEFEVLTHLEGISIDRFPAQSHPFRHTENGVEYLYFGETFPNVRVRATWETYLDPNAWESWTCIDANDDQAVMRDDAGKLVYHWRKGAKPVSVSVEKSLFEKGKIKEPELRYHPVDVQSGNRIELHRGSVAWNDYRNCWVMIACQIGGTSQLGEIYYLESKTLLGPWSEATKVVTHNEYSFYNPVHHPVFDQNGGRTIYFEGTYSRTFSRAAEATTRYDYNQILYRLDLDDTRLNKPAKVTQRTIP